MWTTPDGWLDVLSRAHTVTPEAVVTLDGDELATLRPTEWQVRRSLRGSQVVSEFGMAVVDRDGSLLTDDPRSPLQAYGQRIMFRLAVESGRWREVCPMGVYRTDTASPQGGQWILYPNGRWLRPSTLVDVSGADLLELTSDHDFVAPSVPPAGSSTHTEIRRLIDGDMPVHVTSAARPVEPTEWEGTRIAAVLALFADMDAVAVVGRTGTLESVPATGSGQVLRIAAANPGGYVPTATTGLVDWRPEATREGVYNGVAASGQQEDGTTVRGFAYQRDGALAWKPQGYGRVTYRHESPLVTSAQQAQRSAETRLRNLTASRTRTLTITTLPNPALDVLDTVEVTIPDTGRTIPALVTDIVLSAGQPMTITAAVPWEVPIHG